MHSTSVLTGPVVIASMLLVGVVASASAATEDRYAATEPQFRELYRELVETNTTLSSGSCTEAAQKMARRLQDAGMAAAQMQVLAPGATSCARSSR